MPTRPMKTVAIAGAAAISAGLIGFAALSQTPHQSPQTRPVTLTAGETEIFLPDLSTFTPTVAAGFPPVEEVLQGAEKWDLSNSPGIEVILNGTDTQSTIGSFVNDDFLESGGLAGGAGAGAVLPYPGSEIDLMNFGGGFENEWLSLIDSDGGKTITDTFITPFGNYTIPLGSTPPTESGDISVAAAVPAAAYSFADLQSSIDITTAAADKQFGLAEAAFTQGQYPLALSEALGGLNNQTVGVNNDLLVNGYAALTGVGGNAGYALENPPQPLDLAIALTEVQTSLANVQQDFSVAFTDFASGDTYFGLVNLGQASVDSTSATDAIILGLFDSLIGAGASA